MANYTINSITGRREFEAKHGPLVSYKLTVTGDDGYEGDAEVVQRPETPAPTQGQVIEGTLDTSNPKFPPKLKKAQGGGGFSGGKGKSKADQDSIERAVAYKGAVDVAAALISRSDENISRDSIKEAIDDLFAHGLSLLQGGATGGPAVLTKPLDIAAVDLKAEFPGSQELPSKEELVGAYTSWLNVQPDAAEAKKLLAVQKTALGISADTDSATPEQKADLLAWFKENS